VAFWIYAGLSPALLIAVLGGARVALGTKAATGDGA